MATVGSIGIGLFLLIILWAAALLAFVIAVQFQSNFGWIALFIAACVTIVLIVIPLEKADERKIDSVTFVSIITHKNTLLIKNITYINMLMKTARLNKRHQMAKPNKN